MYDPVIGRWFQEDPIEFEAGDPNLYRYVGNNPLMLTDPSGLQAKNPAEGGVTLDIPEEDMRIHVGGKDLPFSAIPLFHPSIAGVIASLPPAFKPVRIGGQKGYITVRTDAKLTNRGDGWFWIQLASAHEIEGADFLQFASTYYRDKDGKELPAPYFGVTNKYFYLNSTNSYVDSARTDTREKRNVFYIFSGAAGYKGKDDFHDLSMFDKPAFFPKKDDDLPPEFVERVMVFDTFLVVKGKVYYHVHWEFLSKRENGKWQPAKYVNVTAKPADRLPIWALGDKLRAGYRDIDKTDPKKLLNPIDFDNPISRERRERWAREYLYFYFQNRLGLPKLP